MKIYGKYVDFLQDLQKILDDIVEEYEVKVAALEPTETFPVNEAIKRKNGSLVTIAYKWREYKKCCCYYVSPNSGDTSESSSDEDLDDLLLSRLSLKPLKSVGSNAAGHSSFRPCPVLLLVSVAPLLPADTSSACALPAADAPPHAPPADTEVTDVAPAAVLSRLLVPAVNRQPAPAVNRQPAPAVNRQPAPAVNRQPAPAVKRQRESVSDSEEEEEAAARHRPQDLLGSVSPHQGSAGPPVHRPLAVTDQNAALLMTKLCASVREKRAAKKKQKRDARARNVQRSSHSRQEKYSVFDSPSPDDATCSSHVLLKANTERRSCMNFKASTPVLFKQPKETILEKFSPSRCKSSKACDSRSPLKSLPANLKSFGARVMVYGSACNSASQSEVSHEQDNFGASSQPLLQSQGSAGHVLASSIAKVDSSLLIKEAWTRTRDSVVSPDGDSRPRITGYKDELSSPPHSPLYDPTRLIFKDAERLETSSELHNTIPEQGFENSILNMSPSSNSYSELEPVSIVSLETVARPPANEMLDDCFISARSPLGPYSPDIFSNTDDTADSYDPTAYESDNLGAVRAEQYFIEYSYNPDAEFLEKRWLASTASCHNSVVNSGSHALCAEVSASFFQEDIIDAEEKSLEVQRFTNSESVSTKASPSKVGFVSGKVKTQTPDYEVSVNQPWIRCTNAKPTDGRWRNRTKRKPGKSIPDQLHSTENCTRLHDPECESRLGASQGIVLASSSCSAGDVVPPLKFSRDLREPTDAFLNSVRIFGESSECVGSQSSAIAQRHCYPRFNFNLGEPFECESSEEIVKSSSSGDSPGNTAEQGKDTALFSPRNSASPILGLRKIASCLPSSTMSHKSHDLPHGDSVKCNLYRSKISIFNLKETGTPCLGTEDSLQPSLQVAPNHRDPLAPSAASEDPKSPPSSPIDCGSRITASDTSFSGFYPSSMLLSDPNGEVRRVENGNLDLRNSDHLGFKSCEGNSLRYVSGSVSFASSSSVLRNDNSEKDGDVLKSDDAVLNTNRQSLSPDKAPNVIYVNKMSESKKRKRVKPKVHKSADKSRPGSRHLEGDLFDALFGKSASPGEGSLDGKNLQCSKSSLCKVSNKDLAMDSSVSSSPKKANSASSKARSQEANAPPKRKVEKKKTACKSKKSFALHHEQKTLIDAFSPFAATKSRIESLKRKGLECMRVDTYSDDELPDIQSSGESQNHLFTTDTKVEDSAVLKKHSAKQRKKCSSSSDKSYVPYQSISSIKTPEKRNPTSKTQSPGKIPTSISPSPGSPSSSFAQSPASTTHKSSKTIRSEGKSPKSKSHMSGLFPCPKSSAKSKSSKDQRSNVTSRKKSSSANSEVSNRSKEDKNEDKLTVTSDEESQSDVLSRIDEGSVTSVPEIRHKAKRNPSLPRRYDQYVEREFLTASSVDRSDTNDNKSNNVNDGKKKKKKSLLKNSNSTASSCTHKRASGKAAKRKENSGTRSSTTSTASGEQTFLHDWLTKKESLENSAKLVQSNSDSRGHPVEDDGAVVSPSHNMKTSSKSEAQSRKDSNSLGEKPDSSNSEEEDDLDLNYSIDSWGNTVSPKKNRLLDSTVCLESSAFECASDNGDTNLDDPLFSLLCASDAPKPPHCQPERVKEVMDTIDRRYHPEAILDWLPSQLPWLRDVLCEKEANHWHSTYLRGIRATDELNSFLYYGLLSNRQITTITDFLTEHMEVELRRRFRNDPRPFHTYTWRVQVPLVTTRMCCSVSGLSWEQSTELLVTARALKPPSLLTSQSPF